MAGTLPEAPIGGPHPERNASAGITAALAQARAAPLEPPGPCLSWATATDPDLGTATTVSMQILHDGEAEELP